MVAQPTSDVGSALVQLESRMTKLELKRRGFSTSVVTSMPTYAQDTAPTGSIATGAIWYDTSNNNTAYRWDGSGWIPVIDPSVDTGRNQAATDLVNMQDNDGSPDKKITTYVQPNMPAVAPVGDLWIDTDTNKLFRSNGIGWVDTGDTAVGASVTRPENASSYADGKVQTWYQNNPPTPDGMGDLWVDTSGDPEVLYRWNNYEWVPVTGWTLEQINGKINQKTTTFRQSNTPTSIATGDIWYDTGHDNISYRASAPGVTTIGTTNGWILVQDKGIQEAQDTADSKVRTFYQTTIPTSVSIGDLWFDTDDKNKQYRALSKGATTISPPGPPDPTTGWVVVQDQTIADAIDQIAGITSDGLAPTSSPTPTASPGISAIYLRWSPITNHDPVTYEIHMSSIPNFTTSSTSLVSETDATTASVRLTRFNHISNPSARLDVAGWTPASSTVTRSPEAAYAGDSSFRLQATSSTAPYMYTASGLSGIVVTAGKAYRLNARLRAGAGFTGTGGVNMTWYNAAGAFLSTTIGTSVNIDEGSWALATNYATAPVGAAFAAVAVGISTMSAAQGVFYADGIEALDPDRLGPPIPEMTYYFRIVSKDVDGTCPTSSASTASALKLADNEEISTDFLYAGDITVDQLRGGTAAFDFVLASTMSTGPENQSRVQISPAGINIFENRGTQDIPIITLPTSLAQGASFQGSLTADSLTLRDGLEVRGTKNKYTRGSVTTLETQITGSGTPPGVVVDYPSTDWGGVLSNVYAVPVGFTAYTDGTYACGTRFFDFGGITFNGYHYDFPMVTMSDGSKRAQFNPNSGADYLYDSASGKYVLMIAGFIPDGTPQIRKYDVAPMTTGAPPTLLGSMLAPFDSSNIYQPPALAPMYGVDGRIAYTEIMYSRQMRVTTIDITTMTRATPVVTFATATPINENAWPSGVINGPANQLGLSTTDAQNVWVVCAAVGDSGERPDSFVYVFNANGTSRLPQYEFMANGRPAYFVPRAIKSATTRTFSNYISTNWGSPLSTDYTNIYWGSESSTWYAGYTWYSTIAPTYESNISVPRPFTMKKHARLSIATPPLPDPAGGVGTIPAAGDANTVQIYLGRDPLTSPAENSYWRQSAQSTEGSNLVANPNFETDTSFWETLNASGTIARTTATAQSGLASLALAMTATGIAGIRQTPGARIPVIPGQVYTLSAWYRAATAGGSAQGNFKMEWRDASNTALSESATPVNFALNSTTWSWSPLSAQAPANAAFVYCRADVSATSGQVFYYDNFVFSRGLNGVQMTSQPLFGAPAVHPPAASNFPSTGTAYFQSSATNTTTGLPKFRLTGNGDAHFENLDVSGGGVASISQLVVNSTADADTSANNAPSLRVGDIAGYHLRIDGDEIIAMNNNNTQGIMWLNQGGTIYATTVGADSFYANNRSTFANGITVGAAGINVAGGVAISSGGLGVSAGGAYITGDTTTTGTLTSGGALNVSTGGASITGGLSVSGQATFWNHVAAQSTLTTQSSLWMGAGTFTCSGPANISGLITGSAGMSMSGTTNCYGSVNTLNGYGMSINSGQVVLSPSGYISAGLDITAGRALYSNSPPATTGIPDMRIAAAGGVIYYTNHPNSSVRYKKNIELLELTEDQMYAWKGISYQLRDMPSGSDRPKDFEFWGLIAEELEELGFEALIERDEEGEPDKVDYAKMCVVQQQAIRDLHDRLKTLERRIEE